MMIGQSLLHGRLREAPTIRREIYVPTQVRIPRPQNAYQPIRKTVGRNDLYLIDFRYIGRRYLRR